jgi:hypothetical protein
LQGHRRFTGCNRIMQGEVGAQAVPVFHQGVRAETQPGFFPAGFPFFCVLMFALIVGRCKLSVCATLKKVVA